MKNMKKKNVPKSHPPGSCLSIGISLGICFGVVMGVVMDDIGLWIAIGLTTGASIGTVMEAAIKEKSNSDTEKS